MHLGFALAWDSNFSITSVQKLERSLVFHRTQVVDSQLLEVMVANIETRGAACIRHSEAGVLHLSPGDRPLFEPGPFAAAVSPPG